MDVQLFAGHSNLRMKVWDHVLENGEVVTLPFIDSPQTFPLSRPGLYMASYAIGEMVKKSKGGTGVIRAIYTTMEGEQRYAIEDEGALDFVDEASLSRVSKTDLATAKHS
jgi:hypothetical protein